MTLRLAPHSRYRESELPWLGKVPAHWEVRRNGRLFTQRNEVGFPELPILEVSLKTGVRVRDMQNPTRKQVIEDRGKYKRAARGDLAYNMMRMWQGAVGLAPVDGLVSPAYVVAQPLPGTNAAYFNYLFRTAVYMAEVDKFSHGIVKDRNRLYWDDFKTMPAVFPPHEEQRAISRFLDGYGERVQRSILAKLRLAELLNEHEDAIIHRAVTRGTTPNAPTKRSGIDWVGDMPKHWRTCRLKYLVQMKSGEGITSLDIAEKGEFPVYGGNGLRGYTSAFTHEGEFVLIGRQGALCGNINYASGRFWASEHAVVASPRRDQDLVWLGELLRAMNLNQYSQAAAQPGLAVERIQNLRVPVPPGPEQEGIGTWIRTAKTALEEVRENARREVRLLREYRERLISDVVMGRLDVRDFCPAAASSTCGDAVVDTETDQPPHIREVAHAEE